MDDFLALDEAVVLLGFGDEHEVLASRLRRLGQRAERADDLEQALDVLRHTDPPTQAVLLPPHPPLPDLAHSLSLLDELCLDGSMRFVAVGKRPEASQRTLLREAGVGLALWEPYTQAELRFVVNHVLYDPRQGESRAELRVPTRLLGLALGAAGEKEVLVYNLSESGAFLETPRPNQVGAQIEVALPLPGRTLTLKARVVTINVPGTGHNPALPTGMGVRFLEVEPATQEAIQGYVDERARSFQL